MKMLDVMRDVMRSEVKAALPMVMPVGWQCTKVLQDGAAFIHCTGLSVIASVGAEYDGKRWLHVSCAYHNRLPSWDDLRMVKDVFIGKHRKAIQVIPSAEEHININPNCLHLWCCLDVDQLPDFARGGDSI
jgi:hypothetical protein